MLFLLFSINKDAPPPDISGRFIVFHDTPLDRLAQNGLM
jgi:hypothetical protein